MAACVNHPEVVSGLNRCSVCAKYFCPDCLISLRGRTVCAGCKGEQVQDIRSGTAAELDLGGRGARLGSAIVDGLVLWIFNFISQLVVAGMAHGSPGGAFALSMLVSITIATCYEGFMLSSRGQTVGKMALGLKVVNPDGSDITPAQAWKRAISRNLMSATFILGLVDILMIFGEARTCLHDRIAGTVVVRWQR